MLFILYLILRAVYFHVIIYSNPNVNYEASNIVLKYIINTTFSCTFIPAYINNYAILL